MRDNANTSISNAGSSLVHFSFTAEKHNSQRGRNKLFEWFVIRLICPVQFQQFLIFLEQIRFARFFRRQQANEKVSAHFETRISPVHTDK